MRTILFKDLKFGTDVKKGDSIKPYPTSFGLVRINDEGDLLNLQGYIEGDLEVIIDENEPRLNKFRIPAWEQKTKVYQQSKDQALESFRTTV